MNHIMIDLETIGTRPGSAILAIDDGFANTQEMVAWFQDTHSLPFAGWIIKWNLIQEDSGG
jgi:hypothetical protein